jgi:hypothetical protein
MCSTKAPIVQKRGVVGAGGQSDIPPARTQYFSNSMVSFEFKAETNPLITAIMESTSEGDWEKLGKAEAKEDNDQPMLVVWKGPWKRKLDECSLLCLFFA